MNTATAQPRTAFETMAKPEQSLTVIQPPRPISAMKCEVERSEDKILLKLRTLAKAAGQRWYYRYPVKDKKTGKIDYVEGPSIKCAMTVARLWGNSDLDVRVQDEGDHWIFYARFVDFETGFSHTRAYQQRRSQDTGMKDKDRATDMVFQIGQSKAIRNVVCNALSDVTDFAYEEAKNSFVETIGKEIEKYRARILDRLREMSIDVKRVEAVSGRPSKEWLAPDIARIYAELQAIYDGMASIDDTYPAPEPGKEAEPPKPTAEAEPPKQAEPPATVVEPTEVLPPAETATVKPVTEIDERTAEWVEKKILQLGDCTTLAEIAEIETVVSGYLTSDEHTPLFAKFTQKATIAKTKLRKKT